MAAQAEIFLTSSFWALEVSLSALVSSVRLTLRMFCSSSRKAAACSLQVQCVILDVGEVAAFLVADVGAVHQLVEDRDERLGRALD